MRRKTVAPSMNEDLLIDLTLHKISASLVAEFKKRIVNPDYNGNLNAAIQNVIFKALADHNFYFSTVNRIDSKTNIKL
jgi:hypothetical protein